MTADPTFWSNIAGKYAKQPVADPPAFYRKAEIIKGMMNPRSVVLDVGCGTGSLALRLAAFGAHVHGLDFSPDMIRIARTKAESGGVANVSFHEGQLDSGLQSIAPGSLDGLSACSLLHLVSDCAALLLDCFALLKPGGFLVTSTVCLGESWVPYAPILALLRWVGKAPPVWIPGRATVAREIAEAGFLEVQEPDVGASVQVSFVLARRPAQPVETR